MRSLVVVLAVIEGVCGQACVGCYDSDYTLRGAELRYSTAELDTGYSKRDFLRNLFTSTNEFALQQLKMSIYALEGGAQRGSQMMEAIPRGLHRGTKKAYYSFFGKTSPSRNERSTRRRREERSRGPSHRLVRRLLNFGAALRPGSLLEGLLSPFIGNQPTPLALDVRLPFAGDDRVDLATVDYFNYFITIQLPRRQQFKAVFDTGSGDLWVPDLYTCTSEPCLRRHRFDSNLSDSLVTTDQDFAIPYAGNTRVEGKVVREKFDIVGVRLPLVVPPDNLFRMGLAGNLPLPLINQTFDGILGMGLRSRIGTPPLDYILRRKRNDQSGRLHGYSVYLAPLRNLDDQEKVGGQVTFGGTNPAHFQRPLSWFPVFGGNTATHWELSLQSIARLGTTNLNIQSTTALVDTGSPVIGLPYDDAKAINDALNAKPDPQSEGQTSLLPCPNIRGSGNSALPNFSFQLISESGPVTFSLGPAEYAIPDPHQPGFCLSAFVPTSGPGQTGSTFWILGAPFLRSYYAAFDQANLRIGLAKNIFTR